VQHTPADTAEKRRWNPASYADWLWGLSDRLLDEVDRLAEEYPDQPTRELLRKITQCISINQSLVTLQLLNFRLHMRENEKAIDEELREISEHVSEILSVHLIEAENLRKTL
jgi:hypothetical protein